MTKESKIKGLMSRSGVAVVFFLFALVAFSSAFNSNRAPLPSVPIRSAGSAVKDQNPARTLIFADRVAYQYAIEEIYWRHRIWPKENSAPKPSLDEVMSRAEIEKKVETYLRNSQALEDYWQRPITSGQLQAELERMASHTKEPEVLRELFQALGNDSFVIAECLARQALAERLIADWYTHDHRIHGKLKERAEAELRTHRSVEQMKQTSGTYTEMEWVKSDPVETRLASANTKTVASVKLDGSEWQESVEKLAAQFESQDIVGQTPRLREKVFAAGATALNLRKSLQARQTDAHASIARPDPLKQIKTGVLSPLQEDDGHYYAVAVTKKGKDRLKLATISWLKEPLRSWLSKAQLQAPVTMAALSANYSLPAIHNASDTCPNDTWVPSSLNSPPGRYLHTAVWTGTEMIVWGGENTALILDRGGRYNPGTDTWITVSTINGPSPRTGHTAVWTGSEMIVWGGHLSPDDTFYDDTKTGARYNPATESWTPTDIVNAPTEREGAIALWTGTEAIIWGGYDYFGSLNTGATYDPGTNSWTAMSTTNAPRRATYAGVWSGSEMILWGGGDLQGHSADTGAKYNPTTNSWQAISTSNAPTAGGGYTAVRTGSEMIIWGGATGYCDPQAGCHDVTYFNTGRRYNPITDIWTATSTINVPSPRLSQTAVWTGSQMIIWGGGYLFDPQHTGQEFLRDGASYDPVANTWRAINPINSPTIPGPAIWTGNEMIIWGGSSDSPPYFRDTGRRYNPAANVWLPTSTSGNVPVGRDGHTAVWTGTEMIIWGGYWYGDNLNNGGRYCAASTLLPSESDRYDFNGDSTSDYVLLNATTHQTAVWYLNNNAYIGTYIGSGYGPTLPAGWVVAGVADFNGDGKPDYALFNASTHQTAIWYLNGTVRLSAAFGPTVPGGWQLAAVGDFNSDGNPDYVLYNASTRQTLIWYLNNNVYASAAYGPTVPAGWDVAGVADFNGDGHLDYLLLNASTQRTAIWYLNNNVYVSSAFGPTIANGYILKGTADFNGDTKPDFVLYNPSTQRTAIWYLNNNVYVSSSYGPTLPSGWSLVAP
jgi:N-acetylneuraminic acid mutarotase